MKRRKILILKASNQLKNKRLQAEELIGNFEIVVLDIRFDVEFDKTMVAYWH